jgi:hypothetical protein
MDIYPHRGFGCLGQEHHEPARIVLIHDDASFSNELEDRLTALGHEVRSFNDLTIAVPGVRCSDVLEIAIVRPTDKRGGLRIKPLGIPSGSTYAGPVLKFLVDPITVGDVVDALDVFLTPGQNSPASCP